MKEIHINISSSYIYRGANALNLTKAARRHGWKETGWATRAQAEKLGRTLLDSKAKGVVVVLNEKQYTIYNVAQLAESPQTMQEVADEENMGNHMDMQRQWNNQGRGCGLDYNEAVQMCLGEL